jgi:hypothetical protein
MWKFLRRFFSCFFCIPTPNDVELNIFERDIEITQKEVNNKFSTTYEESYGNKITMEEDDECSLDETGFINIE